MPLSTKSILEGVIGGAVLALGSYYAVQYWGRERPEDRFARVSFELLTRAAAAESLLRTSCIPDSVAVTEAYWNLTAPLKAATYPREIWFELDEDLADTSALSIAHELAISTEHYSGMLHLTTDVNEAFSKAKAAAQHVQDNYNPNTLGPELEGAHWAAKREQMRSAIWEGFSPLQESRHDGSKEDNILVQGQLFDWPPRATATLVASQALDSRNEGYWWSTCNEVAFECMFFSIEPETMRLAFSRLREIDENVPPEKRHSQGMLREEYAGPFLMSQAFALFLEERNYFLTDAKSVPPETYSVGYDQCLDLYFDMYPVDVDVFERAFKSALKTKQSKEVDEQSN